MVILDHKTVLVTGGTGSFGQHFVKRALETKVGKVIVFSRDELKQSEMAQKFTDPRLRFFIGDVRDKDRLYRAFREVHYVIHAAALKQVPAAEYNPFEVVKTNVYGTQNVADAAIDAGVVHSILLSTDKAVEPLNLYGSTKLCAEKLWIGANRYSGDRFSVVRYGNVWGSRGSVLPLFLKQRAEGKPLTVTHPEMTRFVLTLDQAVTFVIDRLAETPGSIFIPKIPSLHISRLAECIGGEIQVTGLRPGEKLNETLISMGELRTDCGDYYKIGGLLEGRYISYTSNLNARWILTDEINQMIKDYTDGN